MKYDEIKNYIHPYGVPEKIFNKYYLEYSKKYPGYFKNVQGNKIKTTIEGFTKGTLRAFEIEYNTKGESYLKKFLSSDSGKDNTKPTSKDSKRSVSS